MSKCTACKRKVKVLATKCHARNAIRRPMSPSATLAAHATQNVRPLRKVQVHVAKCHMAWANNVYRSKLCVDTLCVIKLYVTKLRVSKWYESTLCASNCVWTSCV